MATYIKGSAVANATSYELFEKMADGNYVSRDEKPELNFDVSALGLGEGDHVLVVVAKAENYETSAYSNEVVYMAGGSSGSGGNTSGDSGGNTGGNTGGGSGTARTTKNSHATALPASVTSETNLITALTNAVGSYYTASGWSSVSGTNSITFPVLPGDKISGNVFGTTAQNGSTINGTRTTFLLDDTIVESKAPTNIYSEYSSNGYVTVPAGCNCVSIPFDAKAASTKDLGIYLDTL